MNKNPQPQPGATMSYGFIGNWVPPESFGTLLSPPIVVAAANWPSGAPQNDPYPQFATDKGQQIFDQFVPYGAPAGAPGQGFQGYLGNNYDQENKYGTVGPMVFEPNVTAADNWQAIENAPLLYAAPPVAPTPAMPSAPALVGEITALLEQRSSRSFRRSCDGSRRPNRHHRISWR